MLIAEPLHFSEEANAILKQAGDVELRACDHDELQQAFAEYDVVWVRLANRIDRAMLAGKPRCRVLAVPVTGLDHVDLQACAEQGIAVLSLRGEVDFLKEVRATAELTVGLTLALLRKLNRAAAHVIDGGWNRDLFWGSELYGKTAGLVGVGRLGTLVAGYFRAFGMRVIGYDPRPDFPSQVAERVDSIDALMRESDIVSLHVAYQDSTRHLIGRSKLEQMKPSAVLINTSRGGIVDDRALLTALEQGCLAGAALDVLDGEPQIGADHPLVQYAREHDNLLIVPHIGGNTVESFAKTEVFLARKVVDHLRRQAGAAIASANAQEPV
ncbi:MAG TPA: NAD(P)-dependent oxidoreductase [Pirellulales bacterium]|jgi:D-3-phosphoglycerate dehydrogenase